jgi:dihydroorotase
LWIRGKAYLDSWGIEEVCIEFDRIIKNIKKECKADISTPSNTIILPGAIDMHVHVRGSKLSYKETVVSATSEAAYGGITLIVDMPNTLPPINTYERVIERLREFEYYSRTDFGIYAGVSNEALKIENLPIAGFKIYPEDLEDYEGLKAVLMTKKLKILHSEIPLASKVPRKLRELWMEIAALRLFDLKGFHITHASNYLTIQISKHHGATVDITPHHLIINDEKNCLTKVNPPIRNRIERLRLFNALFFEIDAVASDHAPHSAWEKNQEYEICPPGIAGVSFTVPFIFTLVKKGILSLDRAVDLISKNPSKILGLQGYGKIKNGAYANFTVVKFESWRYSTKYTKAIHTPMDGLPLEARVYYTIVQGKVVNDNGEIYPIRGINPFDKSSWINI